MVEAQYGSCQIPKSLCGGQLTPTSISCVPGATVSVPCHLRGLFVTAAVTALYIAQDPVKTYIWDSWCMTRTQQVFTIIITVLFQGSLIDKGYCGVFMSSHMLGLVKAKLLFSIPQSYLCPFVLYYRMSFILCSISRLKTMFWERN